MALATVLGFPRIGPHRELKKALEGYWEGTLGADQLLKAAREIRRANWQVQIATGLDFAPSGDFSLYDHVLDTALLVDAVPQRFRPIESAGELELYFAMAGGFEGANPIAPLEMTKWFDTNYHYLVPEFEPDQRFRLRRNTLLEQFEEARAMGIPARPVLLGPVTFLILGKSKIPGTDSLGLLDRLLPAYEELCKQLVAAGAEWLQVDEPALVLDLPDEAVAAVELSLQRLSRAAPGMRILLATYFGSLGQHLQRALRFPVAAIHLDLVHGREQFQEAVRHAPEGLILSLGLVDGRNVWKTDLGEALKLAERAAQKLGPERIILAPSCSLLHVPVDLAFEQSLDAEVRDWLAFGRQKLEEVVILKRALNEGRMAVRAELEANRESLERRRRSPRVVREQVRQRLASLDERALARGNPYPIRRQRQQAVLNLPPLPTTTIGSFPQTAELRRRRALYRSGAISEKEYEDYIRDQIRRAVAEQERIGLDVLVHGEFERSDMVEYFAGQLEGCALTGNGWVQSYGSRCVKPPIIYGDIERRGPMTLKWWSFTQSLTSRPVKGMLTGPVTMLQWSFVRDDQPRRDTCWQLALAIRDEVQDLERAGCKIIQIDEPALREGLPLRSDQQREYLGWAVNAFRLASSCVPDEVQIHTHMCYAEFGQIMDAIRAMDADVISLEAARSQMELLSALAANGYPNQVGPGVYDVHSPRVPSVDEIERLLLRALQVIPGDRLWVNPDCGLKTRRWEEVLPALKNMVAAAQRLREKFPRGANL